MRNCLWVLPLAVGSMLLAGSVAIAQPAQEPASVDHACAVTMGLKPATADYNACVARLSQTVAKLHDEQALEQRRATCAASGLADGTPDFATCMAQQQKTSLEGRACAEQGLAPGDAGYASCVANLKSAIAYDHYQYSAGE